MNAQNKETDARILIDDQLRAAGWNPADKSQVLTEVKVAGGHFVAEPGAQPTVFSTADGDAIPTGRADYVLLDQRGRPLAIIEAEEGLHAGDKLVLCSVGAGLTTAAIAVEW